RTRLQLRLQDGSGGDGIGLHTGLVGGCVTAGRDVEVGGGCRRRQRARGFRLRGFDVSVFDGRLGGRGLFGAGNDRDGRYFGCRRVDRGGRSIRLARCRRGIALGRRRGFLRSRGLRRRQRRGGGGGQRGIGRHGGI